MKISVSLTLHEEVKGNAAVHEISDTVGSTVHLVRALLVVLHQGDLKGEVHHGSHPPGRHRLTKTLIVLPENWLNELPVKLR